MSSSAWASREIAITFDDAPTKGSNIPDDEKRTDLIIEGLKRANVSRVTFFVNTIRFDKAGRARILKYIAAGHSIANHTHSHPSLNSIDGDLFWLDVERAIGILKPFPNTRPWLRFPYLHEGETKEKRELVRGKLKKAGLHNGYITIDTYDWYLDRALTKARQTGKKIDLDRVREAYVKTTSDSVEFYDNLAIQQLGRSPKHILLLHENDLAALFISDLVSALEDKGWKIISPEEAYADPISKELPQTLELSQGRVAAMARDKGYKGPIRSKWESEEAIDTFLRDLRAFE
jgi:peptidoglycan/xylan/chitin deacetylase (PgdA/CDA1 family)